MHNIQNALNPKRQSLKNAYIGFSNITGSRHSSASNGGVAQSDFTYTLLNEISGSDYYICHSDNPRSECAGNFFPFRLRVSIIFNILDVMRLMKLLLANGPYKNIVIYHSFIFFPLVIYLNLLGLKPILQVNEIFCRSGTHNSAVYKLVEYFMFALTKSYVVSTESIRRFLIGVCKNGINIVAIIPGPINIKKSMPLELCADTYVKPKDDVIRMVYAGVVDRNKSGGAFVAVDLARKLNARGFCIDIFGFGTEEDMDALRDEIKSNNTISSTKVRYCGNLQPEVLQSTITNYDVGLATQYIGTPFSASSFPSKILTYLSAGLNVVCATCEGVALWKEKEVLFIYQDQNLDDLVAYLKTKPIRSKFEIIERVRKIRDDIIFNLSAGLN